MRTFDAQALVQLPRVDAAGAVALGTALITTAKDTKTPKELKTTLTKLEKTTEALSKELGARLMPAPQDTERARKADVQVDACWAALNSLLVAWQRLPGNLPQTQQATDLLARLFDNGLAFIQRPYRDEWAESEARLKKIKADGLSSKLNAVGAAPFLEALTAAHLEYGKALGITETRPVPPPDAAVRASLDEWSMATRQWVLKVASMEDAALVERLLEPVAAAATRASRAPVLPQAPAATSPTTAPSTP